MVLARIASLALILALGLGPGQAPAQTAHVSTLDWPPYTGPDLPRGGATTAVVRKAFEAAGLDTDVVFRPWKRAIDMADRGADDVTGYFPGYHCHHREGFVPSEPIGEGPLGFAVNAEAPVEWTDIDSLGEEKLRIGTVLGYANTDEFDAKVGTGWIRAIPSKDDLTNLRKLLRKRIDMAVIDKFVLQYLKAVEPDLREGRDKLVFDDKTLEDKTLYLCFRDDAAGRAMRDTFNEGLAKIDVEAITDEYFATAFEG